MLQVVSFQSEPAQGRIGPAAAVQANALASKLQVLWLRPPIPYPAWHGPR